MWLLIKWVSKELTVNLLFAGYRFKNKVMSRITPSRTAKRALNKFIRPQRSQPKNWEHNAETLGIRFAMSDEISAIRWLPQAVDSAVAPKTLLLVHGWESRATQMYGLVPKLLALGYQVVGVDMPAHGHSTGDISHAEAFVQTVLLAQEKLGVFDAVIGHSMGAGASSLALSRGLTTKKLVLISGPSSIENVLRSFSKFVGLNKHATDKFVDHAGEMVGKNPAEMDAINSTNDIDVSTLIIHDYHDLEVPISESKRLLPKFSNAELYVTNGLGHRKILKSKEVIEKISHFLKLESAK
ncbi:MAG: pimeloyl-ACP methyl ester carboxylesterase [Alteromonadaceae bacterium]